MLVEATLGAKRGPEELDVTLAPLVTMLLAAPPPPPPPNAVAVLLGVETNRLFCTGFQPEPFEPLVCWDMYVALSS